MLHRAAARTSSDTNLSRRVFSLPKETRRIFRREICVGSAAPDHTRTLRDGSFEGRFPRHFVPGYDHAVPLGTKRFRAEPFDSVSAYGLKPGLLCSPGPSGRGCSALIHFDMEPRKRFLAVTSRRSLARGRLGGPQPREPSPF